MVAVAGSAVILVLVLALALPPFWQLKWAPPDRGVSLIPQRPILRGNEVTAGSAYDLLVRATEAESHVERDSRMHEELRRLYVTPWSDEAFPGLAKMLKESEPALQLAREAASQPNPQVVSFVKFTDSFPYLTGVMNIVNLFRASAAAHVAAGDFAGAFADLEDGLRFVQITTRGGVLIGMLVDVTCEAQLCEAMRLIALGHDLPPETARRAIAQLLEIPDNAEPLSEIVRAEYRVIPDAVKMS